MPSATRYASPTKAPNRIQDMPGAFARARVRRAIYFTVMSSQAKDWLIAVLLILPVSGVVIAALDDGSFEFGTKLRLFAFFAACMAAVTALVIYT